MDCIFCAIAVKLASSEVVYEDEDFVSFKDIHPKAPVHALIIPKKHIDSINHLCPEDTVRMGKMICLAPVVAKKLGIQEGYKLLFNVGKKGGQIVDHIHLHLMGGWSAVAK